jgi:ribosomal protein S18 acetylase RimI-like enzyme
LTGALAPQPVRSPASLEALFSRDRAVHPYGLADIDEPIWSRSTWWQSRDAAVGLLDLPGSADSVVYAISARAPQQTLELLARLDGVLPDEYVVTGPVGVADHLAPLRRAAWAKPCHKMHLADPGALPPPDPGVVPLTPCDLDDVRAVLASDPDAGDFFTPHLLESGWYVGVRDGADLVAVAGVHVVSERHGVAALGNVATHAAHRRRGHARRAVATLCHRLLPVAPTIGLNVVDANAGARALYEQLGFAVVLAYEEAELRRRLPAQPVP